MKLNKFTKTLLFISIFSASLQAQNNVQVLVNSRGTHSIKSYDAQGNYQGDFIKPGQGGLANPEDIVFHPDGSILITGHSNAFIKKYDGKTGEYLGNFSKGYVLSSPSKMSIGPDNLLYVTQWGTSQNKVVRFDLEGNFVDEFTSIGAPKGLGHTWDDEGNFYIALFGVVSGNGTIHKFGPDGADLATFINSAVLRGPTNIWWDSHGNMLVQDWNAGTILRYNHLGEYQGVFTRGLTNPEGLAFLPNGNILIGDWGTDLVHLLAPNGNKLGNFTIGNGLIDPNCVRVRNLATTGIDRDEIIVFDEFVTSSIGRHFKFKKQIITRASKLRIINSMGHTVQTWNQVPSYWNAEGLPSGLYIAELSGTTTRWMQKLIIK